MIAASIVLAEADILQAWYDGLELLNDVCHYCENCAAVLSKGQHLKLVANLSECYTDNYAKEYRVYRTNQFDFRGISLADTSWPSPGQLTQMTRQAILGCQSWKRLG